MQLSPTWSKPWKDNLASIHGGPFANINHGNNSVIATKTVLKPADYVVTEGGFRRGFRCRKVLRHRPWLHGADA